MQGARRGRNHENSAATLDEEFPGERVDVSGVDDGSGRSCYQRPGVDDTTTRTGAGGAGVRP